MQFKVKLVAESSDGRYEGPIGRLFTALQPQVGMQIDYRGSLWNVTQVTWLPEEIDGTWVVLDVRVEKAD